MHSLIAYDHDYNVIATLEQLVKRDASGRTEGHADFSSGGEDNHLEHWTVAGAKGSKTWPGRITHATYRVELAGEPGNNHIATLVHRETGERTERPQ